MDTTTVPTGIPAQTSNINRGSSDNHVLATRSMYASAKSTGENVEYRTFQPTVPYGLLTSSHSIMHQSEHKGLTSVDMTTGDTLFHHPEVESCSLLRTQGRMLFVEERSTSSLMIYQLSTTSPDSIPASMHTLPPLQRGELRLIHKLELGDHLESWNVREGRLITAWVTDDDAELSFWNIRDGLKIRTVIVTLPENEPFINGIGLIAFVDDTIHLKCDLVDATDCTIICDAEGAILSYTITDRED